MAKAMAGYTSSSSSAQACRVPTSGQPCLVNNSNVGYLRGDSKVYYSTSLLISAYVLPVFLSFFFFKTYKQMISFKLSIRLNLALMLIVNLVFYYQIWGDISHKSILTNILITSMIILTMQTTVAVPDSRSTSSGSAATSPSSNTCGSSSVTSCPLSF